MDKPATNPEAQREMFSLVSARVRETYVRKPFYVDGGMDIVSVCRELAQNGLTYALVRDASPAQGGAERLGIFTTTDLRDALLRPVPPQQLAVREVSHFDVVEVHPDAEVFEALWLMVSHRVHRLLVREGAEVLGVLSQLDLVSFVANHSHIIALQIDEAEVSRRVAHRCTARGPHGGVAARQRHPHRTHHAAGERAQFAAVRTRLGPHRTGRTGGEQRLARDGQRGPRRADRENRPGQCTAAARRLRVRRASSEVTRRFGAALADFGYPPCPGNVMLTNPLWCQSVVDFRQAIHSWLRGKDNEGPMNLAIFFDAVCVTGDATLLTDVHRTLESDLQGEELYLARFAAAADKFNEPGNWFTRLTTRRDEQPLDLKKLGTFPIVHGVRALSLQYGVHEVGTVARLGKLTQMGRIDAGLARDLTDALHFLMGLRLSHQLRQRAGGATPGNEVKASALGALEREPLRDSLAIVKRFRLFLRQHFKLDSL